MAQLIGVVVVKCKEKTLDAVGPLPGVLWKLSDPSFNWYTSDVVLVQVSSCPLLYNSGVNEEAKGSREDRRMKATRPQSRRFLLVGRSQRRFHQRRAAND
jgi:hypothetical protein